MTSKHIARLLLAVALLVTYVSCKKTSRTDGRSEAIIEVTDSVWDFGTFAKTDNKQQALFKLKNIGTESFVIHDIRTSCGCTECQFSKEPVEPGRETTIKVLYDGQGRTEGCFSKSLQVFTNAKSGLVYLTIKGNMIK